MESELGRKMEREWVKRWTTEFLGRRNPSWERKSLEESTGMILRLVFKQGCVQSLKKPQ